METLRPVNSATALFLSALLAAGLPFRALAQPTGADGTAALVAQAEELAARGDNRKAEQLLSEAAKAAPGVESIQFRLATVQVYQRRYDEAATIYRALTESKNSAMAALARNSLAALDEEKRRQAEAQGAYVASGARTAEQKRLQAERERAYAAKEADLQARQEIYDLFQAGDDKEAIAKLDDYGTSNPVPVDLQYARVYGLQRMRRFTDAGRVLEAMPAETRTSPEWLLAQATTERGLGRNEAAWEAINAAAQEAEGTPLQEVIEQEIDGLPNEANLDKNAWGELQLDAAYLARFPDTIFYGEIREGTFVPGARWLQPFVQLDFTLDTNSGSGINGVPQVYANNLAGGHLGLRARLIPNENIWAYGLVGVQKDLRDTTRYNGDWFLDWRVGLRGYKGIGPGLTFLSNNWYTKPPAKKWDWQPRAAWFVEGGGDAAYWSLYENFIAYGSLREGVRFLETGGWLAFDLYALQQGTTDSLGLYYNNFGEIGGGLRATARIGRRTTFVTRVEGIGGAYSGINNDNSRGTLPSTYEDLRVIFSLWWEW
jgi:hypothetical protein